MDRDIIIVAVVIILICSAITLPIYYMFHVVEWESEGKVSSITEKNYVIIRYTCIEYYGGSTDCFWQGYDTSEVEIGRTCHIKTHGYYLDELTCWESDSL